jgi:NADPH:quinone reductase-like Zn-dependent oxidoreductase
MKAAVLREFGASPEYSDFEEPRASEDEMIVDVEAAGLNHLDLLKASGKHYLTRKALPRVVGGDGVGRLPDGRRVYFDTIVDPYGSMAERTVVPKESVLDIADDVHGAVAAALGNTGITAWLALEWRARLKPGETVLVLGAGGAVGRVAVPVAHELGAGRVVAVDRPSERLARLGADAVVELNDRVDESEELTAALKRAAPDGVDVILDPLWGPPALAAIQAARYGARHVQIGHVAAPMLTLPALLVRSVDLNLLGFTHTAVPIEIRRAAYRRLTELVTRGGLTVEVEVLPLAEIGAAWARQGRAEGGTKLVMACQSNGRCESLKSEAIVRPTMT